MSKKEHLLEMEGPPKKVRKRGEGLTEKERCRKESYRKKRGLEKEGCQKECLKIHHISHTH